MWLVKPLGFKLDDYYLRRAGLDHREHLEWEVADSWEDLLRRLGPVMRRPPWLLEVGATRHYSDVAYEPGDVLVFGSESEGLPAPLLDAHAGRMLLAAGAAAGPQPERRQLRSRRRLQGVGSSPPTAHGVRAMGRMPVIDLEHVRSRQVMNSRPPKCPHWSCARIPAARLLARQTPAPP